jgi:predicted nucleic acid-binding protein
MIVVADTSPINYLVLIGEIDILPMLYQRILIPRRVHSEMLRSRAPAPVREWANNLPSWCEVREVQLDLTSGLSSVDAGERDAILLALDVSAEALLIDDDSGRQAAKARSLRTTGTLGALEDAAEAGLLNFRDAFRRLEKTNFRMSEEVKAGFLHRNP